VTGGRDEILENLERIRAAIVRGASSAGRDPGEILLVAAAKTVPAEAVRWVAEAGVTAVGENYVQELRAKHDEVPGVRWHYIGTLQTNSAHHVAALADVVETVAGGRATERLARRAAEAGRTLDALLEVDFTGSRTGVAPQEAPAVAARIAGLEGLRLRGLMTLPPPTEATEEARPWFRRLRDLRDRIQQSLPEVVDLSMGMSLDYEVAVQEGATLVRIGTALFGPRTT
jgi:PLP dependent protein